MNKIINVFIKSSIITSIFLLALGLLLIFKSTSTILIVTYIIGIVLIILGIVAIINFIKNRKESYFYNLDIIYGVVTIILGVLAIKNPKVIGSIIPFIVGVGILIKSASKFKYSLDLKDNKKSVWKYTLLTAILSALCGCVLVFNPFKASEVIVELIGVFISAYAVIDIISTLAIKKKYNEISKIEEMKNAKIIEEKEVKEDD